MILVDTSVVIDWFPSLAGLAPTIRRVRFLDRELANRPGALSCTQKKISDATDSAIRTVALPSAIELQKWLDGQEGVMMTELTLESLAKRVEALESALAVKETNRSPKDWRNGIGFFAGSEFMKQVDEEGRRIREADREGARQEEEDGST